MTYQESAASRPLVPRSVTVVTAWAVALTLAGALVYTGEPVFAVAILVFGAVGVFVRRLLSWQSLLTLLILSVLLIPSNLYKLPAVLPFDVEIYRIIAFGVLGSWLIALLIDPETKLRRTPLDGRLGLAVVAILASFATNMSVFDPVLEFSESAKGAIYVVTFFLLFWAIVSVVRDNHTAMWLVYTLVFTGCLIAAFAIVERTTNYNVFRHLEEFIPILEPSGELALLADRGGVRAAGSAPHPIAFGSMLAMIVALPTQLMLESTGLKRIGWAMCAGLILVGMMMTVSRTVIVALAAIFIVLAIVRPRQRLALTVAALTMAVVVHLFFPGVIGTFIENLTPRVVISQETSTTESRLADYPRILAEWRQNPLFGRGVGTFTPGRFFFVDNQYLKYLVEVGFFGFLAMLALFLTAAWTLVRRGVALGGPTGSVVVATGISAFVYALVSATFDAQGFPQVPYLLYIIMALGVAMLLNAADEPVPAGASVRGAE